MTLLRATALPTWRLQFESLRSPATETRYLSWKAGPSQAFFESTKTKTGNQNWVFFTRWQNMSRHLIADQNQVFVKDRDGPSVVVVVVVVFP